MIRVSLDVPTDGSGDGAATTPSVNGLLRRFAYVADGTSPYDATADFTVTDHLGTALLTVADVTASTAWHPRQATHATDGTASLYAAAGEPVESDLPIDGPITVTVAQGGASKTGRFHIWVG